MKLTNIALRNLNRQKRRTLLLAGAIAVGIFIVTLVNGFSLGTVHMLKENLADLIGGHINITVQHRESDKTVYIIRDDAKLVSVLHNLGVRESSITKSVDFPGNLLFNGKDQSVILFGIDWAPTNEMRGKLSMSQADFEQAVRQPNGIIISKKTAEKLKVNVGDSVLFKCKTISGQNNVGEFIVSYITGNTSEYGSMMAFANRGSAVALANLPPTGAYLSLRVRLPSIEMAAGFAKKLEAELAKDFTLVPKNENMLTMDDNVFRVTQSTGFTGERVAITTINDLLSGTGINQMADGMSFATLIMLAVLLGITMLGIANTFRMILFERVTEIGTMRALGMQRGEVRRLMLLEAAFLAIAGVVIGLVLAGIGMAALSLVNFGTDARASILLNNGHLSFIFDPESMAISTLLVIGFTLLAAFGPANRAARLHPSEALRSIN